MPDDGPFPTDELPRSPLLSHLDAVTFKLRNLRDTNLERFAASPHLTRLLGVGGYIFGSPSVTPPDVGVYDAFAASPYGGRVLFVSLGDEGFPGEGYEQNYYYPEYSSSPFIETPIKAHGQALEARYGYLPWLHQANSCERFDAAYYVAGGLLPVKNG